jgi:3-methylcrotonyl-CoA carboxylase alpha subunit
MPFTVDGATVPVEVRYAPGGWTVRHGDDSTCLSALHLDGVRLTGLLGTQQLNASVVRDRDTLHVFTPQGRRVLGDASALQLAGDQADAGASLSAPMPGKVIALLVEAGSRVRKGQPLLVMEAMKMEHTLSAPADGLIEKLPFRVGDQVGEGAALVGFVAG